jgi:ParB family chromosome partitioning protein
MATAKITEFKEISLDDITIGTSQVRTSDTGAEIDELANSIKTMGLLQPIMVAPPDSAGKYEIILGQRRFLAHKQLGKESIRAAVLSEKVDEVTAKIISLTENMMRRNLNTKDYHDVCTDLYKKYGSMTNVAKATGLPYNEVSKYVKYDRLPPKMKKLYDESKVDLQTAILATDAVGHEEGAEDKAVDLALKMSKMGGDQKRRTAKIVAGNPHISVDSAVEDAKKQLRHKVTIIQGEREFQALKDYAKGMGQSVEDAAGELVEESLKSGGFLEDEED